MSAKTDVSKLAKEMGCAVTILRGTPLDVEIAAPPGRRFMATGGTMLVSSQDGGGEDDRHAVWTNLLTDLREGLVP